MLVSIIGQEFDEGTCTLSMCWNGTRLIKAIGARGAFRRRRPNSAIFTGPATDVYGAWDVARLRLFGIARHNYECLQGSRQVAQGRGAASPRPIKFDNKY